MKELHVFIGWDSRFPEVSEICAHSLLRRTDLPVKIHYLKLSDLQEEGIYKRDVDPLASTEFTYSRFLTPYLSKYQGYALFCDNDFLWLDDVAKLLASCNESLPLHCVHQSHVPSEKIKMDGKTQTSYPRKNWSSLMLFNCSHPDIKKLTPDMVNSQSGSYLHQMKWLKDSDIGCLDSRWNWLEGHAEKPESELPGAVHFTRGGPWYSEWQDCDYADLWLKERENYYKKAKNSN